MSTPTSPSNLLHISQIILSTYAIYPTYLSITRTQTYEKTTETLAKYSNIADWHLWKTRKTLGVGTLGIISSLLTSTYLVFQTTTTSTPTSTSPHLKLKTTISLTLCLLLTTSHTHISNYWRGKAKVPAPGMTDYNNAISSTKQMRKCVGLLALSWAVTGLVYGVRALTA